MIAEECMRVESHHGPCLWVHGIATSGITDKGIGSSSFTQLTSLMASTDENELLESVYVPLRDANLMKVGDWDSVSNKHSLAMSLRRLNSTDAHRGIVDFFPETYAMVRPCMVDIDCLPALPLPSPGTGGQFIVQLNMM